MMPYLTSEWGNPSSTYMFGSKLKRAIETARAQVAELIGAHAMEVIFTSCATESNNAAIHAALKGDPKKKHIITSTVEHSSVLNYCMALEKEGFRVTYLPVDREGLLKLTGLENAITETTAVVSLMWANNETGVLFPVKGIIVDKSICRIGIFYTSSIAQRPGDLVQVDTLDIRLFPGVTLKQFTARDVVSRWDVMEVRRRATSPTAKEFLETLERRMPFKVKALQVDGGADFYSDFEEECQRRKIQLFVLPPKSPKLNGSVERAQRTHTEEFYEVYEVPWNVTDLNPRLQKWEKVYNCIRPHQALNYKTPLQFPKDHGIVTSDYSSNLSHM